MEKQACCQNLMTPILNDKEVKEKESKVKEVYQGSGKETAVKIRKQRENLLHGKILSVCKPEEN